MHRIDTTSATPVLPAPGPAGSAGFFARAGTGNAAVATQMSPDWLNAVQEEIAGAIESSGQVLDKGNNSQLLAAIRLFAGRGTRLSVSLPDRQPLAGETVMEAVMLAGETLPVSAPSSVLSVAVAPAANWIGTLYCNGTIIGTVTVPAGKTAGVFAVPAAVRFNSGDLLSLVCPIAQDTALSGLAVAIVYEAA